MTKLEMFNTNEINKEELENILSFNNHAVTMSRIAVSLLSGGNPLVFRGVRELLAMYLLIPYITNKHLDTPDKNHKIPKLDINSLFTKVINKDGSYSEMTLEHLRNAICHSFMALTDKGDLLLDDRASCDRKTHDAITDKGFCNRLELEKTRKKLLSLHEEVIRQQISYNNNLMKDFEVVND